MAGVAFQKFSELADQNLQSGSIETAKIYLKALGQLLHGQPDWTNIGIILTTKKAADYWLANQSDYEMLDIIAKLVLSYSKCTKKIAPIRWPRVSRKFYVKFSKMLISIKIILLMRFDHHAPLFKVCIGS